MKNELKNIEDFNKFCDTSMWCVCGKLMTGLHMSNCRRLNKIRAELILESIKQGAIDAIGDSP